MDKEKKLREAERNMIIGGIFAMDLVFACRNPETGKIYFFEEPPKKMRMASFCMRKAKTYMEKRIKLFMKAILMMKIFVFWGFC